MPAPVPISVTHAEARALLAGAHPIAYRDSMLGATVQARCDCGWRSSQVNAGYMAQAAAERHHAAVVDHRLEQRRRYAIYRDEDARWILLDREGSDRRLGCSSLAEAFRYLDRWTRQEPTA
jgi:hypothetical protein